MSDLGLTNQLRRAAVSIPSNIAEGKGRLSTGELIQFLGIARGSTLEVQTQLELASMLGFGEHGGDRRGVRSLALEEIEDIECDSGVRCERRWQLRSCGELGAFSTLYTLSPIPCRPTTLGDGLDCGWWCRVFWRCLRFVGWRMG